jgi:hypothetical protein
LEGKKNKINPSAKYLGMVQKVIKESQKMANGDSVSSCTMVYV